MLIDSHAHLNEIEGVEGVVERALAVGIRALVAVGMDVPSNIKTLDLASRFPGLIYPAIGYHPWSIIPDGIDETLAFIDGHLDECVALGEVGLDYRAKIKKAIQQEVFGKVLAIARAKKRPVIVHSRYSHERTHKMVSEIGVEKAVFHWYSGPLDVLERIMRDGYFVSASPALAYSPPHRAAMERAPLEQILVETDAPVEYQGKVSEPADLLLTVRELSLIKKESEEVVARITSKNAMAFFGISPLPI